MVSFFGDNAPPEPDDVIFDDEDEFEEPELACPACGEESYSYVGEAYDDEAYLGAHYKCDECGHEFNAWD